MTSKDWRAVLRDAVEREHAGNMRQCLDGLVKVQAEDYLLPQVRELHLGDWLTKARALLAKIERESNPDKGES